MSGSSTVIPPTPVAAPPDAISFKWVENFYKECGREITLAYTTLNQMKNWAMVIAGAVLSGLAFGSAAGTYPTKPMFIGVVIAFAFTLRFFIRAILCYINLSRWNTLQRETLEAMIWTNDPLLSATPPPPNPSQFKKLAESIRNLFLRLALSDPSVGPDHVESEVGIFLVVRPVPLFPRLGSCRLRERSPRAGVVALRSREYRG